MLVEVFARERIERSGADDSGVVDDHVDAAERLERRMDDSSRRRRLSEVSSHGNGAVADLGRDRLQPIAPPADEDDAEAARGEASCGRGADARAGAGDDRDAAHPSPCP